MKLRMTAFGFAMILALSWTAGASLAHPPGGMQPPPPMFHMMKLSGISGDQQHLYVMAGGKIMQYGLTDMKLSKTVDMPEPPPPPSHAPDGAESNQPPPPPPHHMGWPTGLWAGNGVLYVLAGPVVYWYSTPDLKLQSTVELPKPAPPKELQKPASPKTGK